MADINLVCSFITRMVFISTFRTEIERFDRIDQLKLVKGIGAKSFHQAAGFLRIYPIDEESGKKAKDSFI